MDLKEKVTAALRESLHTDQIVLEDDDGIIGYVVSAQFRGMPALDRQRLVSKALRDSSEKLSKAELRRVLMIAALTPAEHFEAADTTL